MSKEIYNTSFDDDTNKILSIAKTFLIRYFGIDREDAALALKKFASDDRFDEDFIHRESSYVISAICFHIYFGGGDKTTFGKWLVETGHINPPREAIEYFNENYFV